MLVCLLAFSAGSGAIAQSEEHPFIARFTLTELEGRVVVAWTMQGGSTCDGSEVERSTDGITFSRVHRLDGICGDAALDVPFTWTDLAPPELSTLYYRIKLGLNDGYSSVRSIRYDQLHSADIRVFPVPSAGPVTVVVNSGAGTSLELRVFGADGRVVIERSGLTGRRHELDLSGISPGAYRMVAIGDGRIATTGFVIQ